MRPVHGAETANEPSHSPAAMEHALEQCIVTVLESPTAIASVIDVVRRALIDGALDKRGYTEVQVALVALYQAMSSDPR